MSIEVIADYGDELRTIEAIIKSHTPSGGQLRILEAGCGREWYFPLEGINYHLTGVDLDADALKSRVGLKQDLDEAIVGDLRTLALPSASFDVIYNAFVLEHMPKAEEALQNFVSWLRPGGLLILRFPDRDSAHGFLARWTPHWVHVWYYKLAWRQKNAGKPGYPPYPVVYDRVVSARGIRDFCQSQALEVVKEIGVGTYRRGHGVLRYLSPAIATMASALSFGRIHSRFVDLTFVVRKPAEEKSQAGADFTHRREAEARV